MSNTPKEKIIEILSDRNLEFEKNASFLDEYARICHNYEKTAEELVDDIEAQLTDDPSLNIGSKFFVSMLERQYKKETKRRLSTKMNKPRKKEVSNSAQKREMRPPAKIVGATPIRPVSQTPGNSTGKFATPVYTPFTKQAQQFSSQNVTYVDFTPSKESDPELFSREKVLIAFNCRSTSVLPHLQSGGLEISKASCLDENVKYMNDVPLSRQRVLVNHVCDLSEYILTRNRIAEDVLQPVNCLANTEGVFWGRILSDSGDGNKPLNDGSIILEAFKETDVSDDTSSGNTTRCVRLDLTHLKQKNVLFFPGQVAAVKGVMNDSPRRVVVKEVYNGVLPKIAKPELQGRGFSMVVAAGPYSTSDNMDFHTFKTLLQVVNKRKPDILMLIGPFVDTQNESVRRGTLGHTYEEVFEEKFIGMLRTSDIPGETVVVLVPSLRDAHHDFVYPQPPLSPSLYETLKDDRFILLSNPAVMNVNGVSIGVNSHDVISQIRKHCYSKQVFEDRIIKFVIMENITRQNSFYPPFFSSPEVPLDYSLAKEVLEFKNHVLPALVIMPSSTRPSVCISGDVVFLNPNYLTRGKKAGSYAHIHIPDNVFEDDIPDDIFDDDKEEVDEDKMDMSEDGEEKKKKPVVKKKKGEIIDHKKKIQIQIVEM